MTTHSTWQLTAFTADSIMMETGIRIDRQEMAVISSERLLSVKDAASILNCSPDTVRRRILDGLRVKRFGRLVRIDPDDLREYLGDK